MSPRDPYEREVIEHALGLALLAAAFAVALVCLAYLLWRIL